MADQRIQYTENMVGNGHPTLADTLNRMSMVSHENDGTHKFIADTTDSSSTSTGAIVTAGGLGVAKKANIGGNLSVGGNATITGTVNGTTVPTSKTLVVTTDKLSALASTTSAELAGVISDETGSGSLVFNNSPTLVTPTIGAATATSVNKVAITAPATGSTLTIADGKTLTASNTLTLAGTDGSTLNVGTGGTLGTAAYTPATDYAVAAKGVTNGDSHDHSGGDGAQIAYSSLSGLPSLGTISSQAANNVVITGGTINGTAIGGTTPAAGAFTTLSATGVTSHPDGTAAAPAISFTSDTNTGIYRIGADNVGIACNGAKVVDVASTGLSVAGNISAGGSVGIGTTGAPAYPLDVVGQTRIEVASSNAQLRLGRTTTSAGHCWLGANSVACLDVLNSGFTTLLRLTQTGNLLIGTTTDDGVNKLQVNGGISSTGLAVTGTIKGSTTLAVGNATPAASGAGITFPATQSASSDPNTLDDYEEGTWTPTFTGWTAAPTEIQAIYTKVGRLVTISANVNGGTIGSGTSIQGLPFTSNSNASTPVLALNTSSGGIALTATIGGNSTSMVWYGTPNITGYWQLSVSYTV